MFPKMFFAAMLLAVVCNATQTTIVNGPVIQLAVNYEPKTEESHEEVSHSNVHTTSDDLSAGTVAAKRKLPGHWLAFNEDKGAKYDIIEETHFYKENIIQTYETPIEQVLQNDESLRDLSERLYNLETARFSKLVGGEYEAIELKSATYSKYGKMYVSKVYNACWWKNIITWFRKNHKLVFRFVPFKAGTFEAWVRPDQRTFEDDTDNALVICTTWVHGHLGNNLRKNAFALAGNIVAPAAVAVNAVASVPVAIVGGAALGAAEKVSDASSSNNILEAVGMATGGALAGTVNGAVGGAIASAGSGVYSTANTLLTSGYKVRRDIKYEFYYQAIIESFKQILDNKEQNNQRDCKGFSKIFNTVANEVNAGAENTVSFYKSVTGIKTNRRLIQRLYKAQTRSW